MPPARRRIAAHEGDVPVHRFVRDCSPHPACGRDPWFHDTEGHATVEAARAQWRHVRREAWGGVHVFRLPTAAQQYDGLTNRAWAMLWSSWTDTHFDATPIRAALRADRRAVERFIRAEPEGARQIADFLCTWSGCLDTIAACVAACDRADDVRARLGLGIHKRINSSRTYGDAQDRRRGDDNANT